MKTIYRLMAVLATAALMTLGLCVGGANAASNGDHDQSFTCTTPSTPGGAGTTFTSVFSYHVTGVGTSAINRIVPDRWAFHTSPAAQLDFINIIRNDLGHPFRDFGGTASGMQDSEQNDVGSSYSTETNWALDSYTWENGEAAPQIRLKVIGGVGNGNGQCIVTKNML